MGLFNEWMNEQKELESLIESAGNLKGLPKNIIKRIVSRVMQQMDLVVKIQRLSYLKKMQNKVI